MVRHRKSDPQQNRTRSGCGFLFATAAFASFMLIINGLLIMGLYPSLDFVVTKIGPAVLQEQSVRERTLQGAMFIGPVLLLIIEWCILDRFMIRSERRKSDRSAADRA